MLILYILLTILLLSALSLLAIPFIKNQALISRDFFVISLFTILFSFTLYQFFGQSKALSDWFAHGKNHYKLMVEVERLGGIDGIISRLQNKLAANPNDAKGWLILGKLYYAKQNFVLATDAFSKAHDLQPADPEINRFYQMPAQ